MLMICGMSIASYQLRAQTYFINEGFNTASGTTAPIGWTIKANSGAAADIWRFDNPGNRVAGAPVSGKFAIFDSEHYGTMTNEDVALESPTFSTAGNNRILMQWDQVFPGVIQPGVDSISVEVNDGIVWHKVYGISTFSTTPVNSLSSPSIDISAYAANNTQVKVRFRYTGNFSTWWIVDNVKVCTTSDHDPVFTGGANQTITACQNTNLDLNNLLKVNDADAGQTLSWTVLTPPIHGSLNNNSANSTSNAGNVVPTGFIYTPLSGFASGLQTDDQIVFQVSDGIVSTTTTVNIHVPPAPTITIQPYSMSVMEADNAGFSVGLSNTMGAIYQWQEDQGGGFVNLSNGGMYSGVTSASLLVSGVTAGMNTYQYRCIISYGCTNNDTSNAAILIVTPTAATPVVQFANGDIQTITFCANSIKNNVSGWFNTSVPYNGQSLSYSVLTDPNHGNIDATFGIPFNVNTVFSNPLFFTGNSFTYTPDNNYVGMDTVIIQVTDGVSISTSTIYITINPVPDVSAISNKMYCNGNATTIVPLTGSVTGSYFNYFTSGSPITSGAGDVPSFIARNNNGAPVTSQIGIVPFYTNAGTTCKGDTGYYHVTIFPTPRVVRHDTVLCNNVATNIQIQSNLPPTFASNVTYDWTNDNTNIGLGNNGSVGFPAFTTTNTTSGPATAAITGKISITPTYTDNTSGFSCQGPSETFSITVLPNATIDPIADQYYCIGATTNAITLSGTGTQYQWLNGTQWVIDTTVANASVPTIGNIPSFVAGEVLGVPTNHLAPITVFTTYTYGGSTCSSTNSQTFYFHTDPLPVIDSIPDQTICNGTISPTISITSVIPSTYIWTCSDTTIGLAASGAGDIPSFLAVNNGITLKTATITVTPTAISVLACSGPVMTFTITVVPTPTVNQVPDQPYCYGATTNPIILTGVHTEYDWTNGTIWNIGGVTNNGSVTIGIGNVPSFVIPAYTGGTTISFPITVTPIYTYQGKVCNGSNLMTFNYVVDIPAHIDPIQSQVLCNGTITTDIIMTGSNSGNTLFNWSNSDTTIGLTASGTGEIPPFTAINTGNAPVTATITVTPQSTVGLMCNGTPTTFTITVNPTPTVDTISDQHYCADIASTPIHFTGYVPGTQFSWSGAVNNPATASGTGDISPYTTVNNGITPLSDLIYISPSYTYAGLTCYGTISSFQINVEPHPTVNATTDIVTCNGVSTGAINFSGAVPGTVFNWTNDRTTIGLVANGTGDIGSFIASNSVASIIAGTIITTPTYTNSGLTCSGTPDTFTISVNPATVSVNNIPNQVLCSGSTTTAINFSGSAPGTVYNWANSNPAIGLSTNSAGDIAPFTVVNSGTTVLASTISVTPVYAVSGGTCTGTTKSFTITINPKPTINPIPDQVLCNNTMTSASFSSSVPGTVFDWINSAPGIGLISTGTGNIPAFSAINNGTLPVIASVNVTSTYTNAGLACPSTPSSFTITVNPTTSVDPVPDQLICSGTSTTSVNFTGGLSGTIYSWTNSAPSIGLVNSATGNIASFVANNFTQAIVNANIVATPLYTNAGVTCTGNPIAFTITVNPAPIVSSVPNQVLCAGTATAIGFSGGAAGTVYNWTNNNTSVGIAALGSGDITNFIATNNDTIPAVATLQVTPSFTYSGLTCTGLPSTSIMTVNPNPTVDAVLDQVICHGYPSTPINFTGSVPGTLYTWGNNNPSIGIISSGTGDIPSFIATNPSNVSSFATFTVTPSYTSSGVTCTGSLTSFNISVNPTTTSSLSITSNNNNITAGDTVTFTAVTSVVGGIFQWQINGINVGTNSNTFTYTPISGDNVKCIVTSPVGVCYSSIITTSNTILMIVNAPPTPLLSLSAGGISIASPGTVIPISVSLSNAGNNYTIIWYNKGVPFDTIFAPATAATFTKDGVTDTIVAKIYVPYPGFIDSALSNPYIFYTDLSVGNVNGFRSIFVYPNPTMDQLHIDNVQGLTSYRVFNIVGVNVLEGNFEKGSNQLSLGTIASGVYMMELNNSQGEKAIVRIIKQ